ncbi:hypothetical protein [Pontibacter burrus]|uniref:XRE family transcriptional regulator n=1 Tax=Pontibacter burrus TaxID=2704466 RepID=A0A6B3LJQ9_9BACT|nr:hypothetical protein [Pontibacter burrus]NEM96203.1 hypothetical protein [Pontibacter burrus]
MYDNHAIRGRFLDEVERLVSSGICRSYAQVAEGCGLKSYHLSDIRNVRSELSLPVLVDFVSAYREHGVSYAYILDGVRTEPLVVSQAYQKLQQAQEALKEIRELLNHGTPNL